MFSDTFKNISDDDLDQLIILKKDEIKEIASKDFKNENKNN